MSEYYYDKHYKKWFDTMHRPNTGLIFKSPEACELNSNLVYELRHARKNNNFMIIRNKDGEKYPGIFCDYIYIPISQLKLITTYIDNSGKKEKYTYCAYKDIHSSGRSRFPITDIINWKQVSQKFTPDLSYIIEYVEDVSYLDYNTSNEEKMKYRKKLYNELDDSCKLYYQIEGKYNFQ